MSHLENFKLYCVVRQEDEFTFKIYDSKGELLGVRSTIEDAESYKSRKEVQMRDAYMKTWNRGTSED